MDHTDNSVMPHSPTAEFPFAVGDVVLAEWDEGKVYYAKIQDIHLNKHTCELMFDDDSVEEAPFSAVHSVSETTNEIVCIICKSGISDFPNEIVLCDKCGLGEYNLL
ncbi:metal-response element-binding transcription factor 2-like [Saccoglossus kowalevskii]